MKHIVFLLPLLLLLGCNKVHNNKKPDMKLYDAFIAKEKFTQDAALHYPGLEDTALKPVYTEKINRAAADFKEVALSGNPTDENYQDAIRKGLGRFTGTLPDTEDRERICTYFEELMDIAGVQSSDGLLNDFMYGF
jgi:Domain of unknown function (DUF4844)